MPPAVAIAGITAAATIGGSVLSSSAQKKAANQASDTAAQTAADNNAVAREIYGSNKGMLNPYVQRGNAAGNAINSLLGLGGENAGGPQAMQLPQQQQGLGSFGQGAVTSSNSYGAGGFDWREPRTDNGGFYQNSIMGAPVGSAGGFNPVGGGGFGYQNGAQGGQAQMGGQEAPQTAEQDYNKAFENYRNSTGYQFRVNEGNDSINSGYAASGALRSGAAMKSLANYNQNIASGEFGNYLGYLGNQQGVGLAGASALAGVGQNYANNVTANNNSAGTVAANAALAKGQANANMYGGIASGIGNLVGSSFG